MKKLLFLFVAILMAVPAIAETVEVKTKWVNTNPFVLDQDNNWQAEFLINTKVNRKFKIFEYDITIKLTGDGGLKKLIPAKFNENLPNYNSNIYWTTKLDIDKANSTDKKLVYKVRYECGREGNYFPSNMAIAMASEYIKFISLPTYGALNVKMSNIKIRENSVHEIPFATIDNVNLEYIFGDMPNYKPSIYMLGLNNIKDNAELYNLDIQLKNPDNKIAGFEFNLKIPNNFKISGKIVSQEIKTWQNNYNLYKTSNNYNYYRVVLRSDYPGIDYIHCNSTKRSLIKFKMKIDNKSLIKNEKLTLNITNIKACDNKEPIPNIISIKNCESISIKIIESVKPREKGDVDFNHKVELKDAGIADLHLLKLLTLTGDDFWAADMNDNGKIEINDPVAIAYKAGYNLEVQGIQKIGKKEIKLDKAKLVTIIGKNLELFTTKGKIKDFYYNNNGKYFILIFKKPYSGTVRFINNGANINRGHQFNYSTINSVVDNREIDFKIFPNPVANRLQIEINSQINKPFIISIMNETGQLVLNKKITKDVNHADIDISNLQSGFYTIYNANGYIGKFIKK